MFGLGPVEIVVIGAIAVMLYGKRLPEVGKSVGQTIGELRRQMASLSREVDLAAHVDGSATKRTASRRIGAGDEGPQTAGPRFDPPAAAEETAPS